ncbi:MAG: ABC transporter substrate-binding protein, partial [Chloroflexi bacterium]|nr:ABC transporter substrate-binding protein [Chloroflexota bacterium]
MLKLRTACFFTAIVALLLTACAGATTPAAPAAATQVPAPAETAVAAPAEPPTAAPPTAVPTQPPARTEPAVLKIGWLGRPDSLNPAYAFEYTSYRIFDLVYSTLTTEGPEGKYVGDLAEKWSASPDGLTWTFTLRDNLKWHDGAPLTAEDVVWSINAIMNDPDGWATLVNYTSGFEEATAPNPKTVVIKLADPIGNMEYRVSWLFALPRTEFEGFATPDDLHNFANDKMLGSGPFKLDRYEADQGVVLLSANPDFYLGAPQIDQIIWQSFDNGDAMVQALKVGDIDLVNSVPNGAFATVKTFDNVKTLQMPDRSFDELIINTVSPDNDPKPTGHPALADPIVRQAIAHAVNKQDLVEIVYQGLAQPGWSLVAPVLGGGFWHTPNIQDVEFNLATANQLLDDAGYAKEADGIRAKDGRRLELRLQYAADSAEYPRVADLIAGWLNEIGIKATPAAVDGGSLTAATTGVGDYDLVIWGWGGDPDPDFILSIMLSDQFAVGGWSDSGYHNPEYDDLYLQQQVAVDPAERQKIIWQMQEMIFKDKPYIILYNYDSLQAYRSDRFKNFIESPYRPIESRFSLLQAEPV